MRVNTTASFTRGLLTAMALLLPSSTRSEDADQGRKGDAVIRPSDCRSFFEPYRQAMPKTFRGPYLTDPTRSSTLKASPYLLHIFTVTLRTWLRADYIPSAQYLLEHVELYPATEDCPYDRMILRFRKGDTSCMVVRVAERMFFFAKRSAGTKMKAGSWHERPALDMLRDYLVVPLNDVTEQIRVQPQGEIGVFKGNRDVSLGNSRFSDLEGAISDNEIALSLCPWPSGIPAARALQPNEWFDFLKRMEKETEGIEKANREKHSPERVEEERRQIESNMF